MSISKLNYEVIKLNKNIKLMFSIVFLQGFIFYGPFSTLYRLQNGVSISNIFLIEGISLFLIIVAEIPFGIFADKFGYKKTLLLSNFLFLISKIVFFYSASFLGFLFERILLSFAVASSSGCDIAFISTSLDQEENREKTFSRYNFFQLLGFLISCVFSGLVYSISLKATALFTIPPYFIGFILTLFLKEPKKLQNTIASTNFALIKDILKNKSIIVFLISLSLILEVAQSSTVFLNQIQYEKASINTSYFGIILTFITLLKLLSAYSYKVNEALKEKKSLYLFYGVIFLSTFLIQFTSSKIFSILFISLIALSSAFIIPIVTEVQTKWSSEEKRATSLSIYSMIMNLASSALNPVIGVASSYPIKYSFLFLSILSLISIFLLSSYYKK